MFLNRQEFQAYRARAVQEGNGHRLLEGGFVDRSDKLEFSFAGKLDHPTNNP